MFRNQYDSDVTVWSPQGRLHQVEYALEAVKQGSATVGLVSKTDAVLVALKRAANDLCSHQKKIFEVDRHVAVSIAGLLSDGRILARFLQSECSSWRWNHGDEMPIEVLNNKIQLKLQANTQEYGRRPFGVGLLIAGYDDKGPRIVRTDPSGEVTPCRAMSIGSRSQSARTYLEKHLDSFTDCDVAGLIKHALLALRDTLPAEENLSTKNTAVAVVGKSGKMRLLEDADVEPYLRSVDEVPRARAAPAAEDDEPPPPAEEPMEDAQPQA